MSYSVNNPCWDCYKSKGENPICTDGKKLQDGVNTMYCNDGKHLGAGQILMMCVNIERNAPKKED